MEILDKINVSPKWVPPIKPTTFKTTLEQQRFYEEEKRRWREGYGDGYAKITGMHYFYLTQGTLKDGSDGDFIKPKYRDCDEWIIEPLHNSFWNLDCHQGLVKRREIGATSIGAGLLPAYTFKMYPNSTFGMTSCDQTRIFKAVNDKTDVFLKRMNKDIAPIFDKSLGWKQNATKQQVYMNLPWFIKNKDTGEMEVNYSELYAKETSESDSAATGFSSTRLRAAYLDEFPLHKRKAKLIGSIKSTVMKGAAQSGLLYWAGTVEDTLTASQINELKTLVANSEELNFNITFAAAWWGLFLNENGVTDEQKGIDWVYSEREKLARLDDKSFLKAFIKNYPLTLDEILDLGGGGRFDEETVERINSQDKFLRESKDIPVIGHRIEVRKVNDTDSVVEAVVSPDSELKILEHPKPGVSYVVGYDGIHTSELSSTGTSNSKMAIVVMKGIDPQSEIEFAPVAIWSLRPKSIIAGNLKVVDVLLYYNKYGKAKFIGELNAGGEHMITLAQSKGLGKTIMHKRDLSKKGYVDTKKIWFYRTDDVLEWQNEAYNIYLKKYAHKIMFRSLLLDALKADNENKDEEDAMKACIYGFGSGDILETIKPKKKRKPLQLLKYVNGRPVIYEVQIELDNETESDSIEDLR
jgi:hypothetical protein